MRYLFVFALLGIVAARTGFDSINPISVATFQCLKNKGHDFFIARVWRNINNYDLVGIQNIKNARAAGFTDVDAYIYPCLTPGKPAGANQVEAAIDKLNEEGAKIGTLWLDIEDDDNNRAWPSNQIQNQNFIQGMADAAEGKEVRVGIYTRQSIWPDIVGSWTAMSKYPLWWSRYNNDAGFGKFVPFGGWSTAEIHQYDGDVKNPPCGLKDMDLNYKD
ncbi:unnamed protein product, partial [Mesorhabditis spiculigera]